MPFDNTNDTTEKKLAQAGPLTRADIADVLMSFGPAGENRDQKREAVKRLTEDKTGNHSDGLGGHKIWDTLEDWPEF